MHKMNSWALGVSASILALAASETHAETIAEGPAFLPTSISMVASAAVGTDSGTDVADSGAGSAEQDAIVVTAQRREERLKDVPITVMALSGNDLAASGATGSRDLQAVVPGLTITSTGQYTQATIRGVGTSITNGESPVSVYVDGVYFTSQIFSVFDLVNVDSVQVLKGPQGTLFGRNATGGAILVTTRTPGDKLEGKMSATYGRFDQVRLTGYVGGPLSDTLKADLVAFYHDDNGYSRDALLGTQLSTYREYGVRGKLLFQPTDNTHFKLIGDWGRLTDSTGNSVRPFVGTKTSIAGAFVPANPFELALTFEPYSKNRGGGVSFEAQHDFAGMSLKSLSAYRATRHHGFSDQDRTPAAVSRVEVEVDQKVFTQEFTLASTEPGPLQWLVGAFYFNEKRINPTLSNGALVTDAHIRNEAYAGFGELTFQVADPLKLIAGIRYSSETTDIDQTRGSGTPRTFSGGAKFDAWTPRFSFVYSLNDDSNLYATYSQGFKSGLINATTFAGAPIAPEKLKAYEVGYKLAARGISFNLSGFYYDYKDLQLSARTPGGLSFILNAANAEIYGLDADMSARLAPGLRFRAGANYTHSKYVDFTQAPFFVPAPGGGNTAVTGDASGNDLIRTPKFTGNVGLDYRQDHGRGAFIASTNLHYNSGFAWTVDGRVRQPDYALLNAEIGWAWNDDKNRITLWGKNLTNTVYGQGVSVTGFADAVSYARPRTYGITLEFGF
jgi:iron complex outermembrane receptor protein